MARNRALIATVSTVALLALHGTAGAQATPPAASADAVPDQSASPGGSPTQPSAAAQSAGDGVSQAESPIAFSDPGSDIVVTARKRLESAQDVPVSISVITGAKLEEQNLTTIASLQSVTAGLFVVVNPKNTVNLTLRGLGTGSAVDSFEQSVASFVDGTYAGRPPEFNASLFDVDRVEIVRGAQASLLSKNTSLGAISITTRKPGDRFGFDVSGTHDFALGSNNIEAGVNLPVSDTLKLRVSGRYDDLHGYLRNPYYNIDIPRRKNFGGRIIARYQPDDRLDITLLYQHYRLRGTGLLLEYYNDPTGQIASLAALAGDTNFETRVDDRSSIGSRYGPDTDRTNGNRAIATVNYNVGSGYTLTSVTSYSDYNQHRFQDIDQIVGDYTTNFAFQGNRQWQQELRLTSPSGPERPIDFLVGAAAYRETWIYREDLLAQCPGCSPLQLSRYPIRGGSLTADRQLTRNVAGFAQVNGHLTDRLTLSGGLRYTNERRQAALQRRTTVPGLLTAILYQPYPLTVLRREENNVDGSVSLAFKAKPNLLLYASASRGTKGGGFINFATNPSTPAGALAATYQPETAYTFEIGEKYSFGNGGFLNFALFDTEINNFQNAIFVNPNFITTNRDLYSRGGELEAAVPLAEGLRLQGQLTYADTVRKDTGGLHPIYAPKWSGNVNLSVRRPLGDGLTFTGDLGSEFRSGIFLTDEELTIGYPNAPNNIVPRGGGYALLNLRLGVRTRSGIEAAIIGRNLADKRALIIGIPAAVIGTGAYVTRNVPRTVALQLSYRY